LTYFHNNFDTLTVLGTVGGADTPVAQGQALYEGIEFMTRADFGDMFNWTHNPYAQIAYTWFPTAETTSAFHCLPDSGQTATSQTANYTGFCPGGNVFGSAAGKRAAYAPENLLTITMEYSQANGFDAHLEVVFVSKQFSDLIKLDSANDMPSVTGVNRDALFKSGQFGKINDYVVINFANSYKVRKDLTLFMSMKNILDNTYIVDHVRGIQPGAPRLVQAGFKYEF